MDRPRFVQTFGAALWIVDYVLQGALNGVDRLYFHQGNNECDHPELSDQY